MSRGRFLCLGGELTTPDKAEARTQSRKALGTGWRAHRRKAAGPQENAQEQNRTRQSTKAPKPPQHKKRPLLLLYVCLRYCNFLESHSRQMLMAAAHNPPLWYLQERRLSLLTHITKVLTPHE
jgi:hypothetical protein